MYKDINNRLNKLYLKIYRNLYSVNERCTSWYTFKVDHESENKEDSLYCKWSTSHLLPHWKAETNVSMCFKGSNQLLNKPGVKGKQELWKDK